MKHHYLFILIFLPILAQAQESQFQSIDTLNRKISNPDALSKQLPVVIKQNTNDLFACDSLPEIQQLEVLSQHRQHLIDSLQSLDLPDEISHYLDSLTQIPGSNSRYTEKVKELQGTGLDSLSKTQQLQAWLSDEQEGLTESLLPEDFTEKLSKYKNEPWSQKATEIVNSKQSEYDGLKDKFSRLSDKVNQEKLNDLRGHVDKLQETGVDQSIEDRATKLTQIQDLQTQSAAMESLQKEQLAKMDQLRSQQDYLSKINQKKDQVLANDVLNSQTDIVELSKEQTAKLLNKYVKLENSNDPGVGEKMTEEAKKLKNRLVYGLNFQFIPRETITLDLSPMVAYKIDKRLTTGMGGTFRYAFAKGDNILPKVHSTPVFGFRMFTQYKVYKGFYTHAEWEKMHIYHEQKGNYWEDNLLAGVGKDIKIRQKLNFSVILLYNFNRNSESYNSAIMLRRGLRVN